MTVFRWETARWLTPFAGLTLGSAAPETTASTALRVSATSPAVCSVAASAPASWIHATVGQDATATISVTCTDTTPYVVTIDDGLQSADGHGWNLAGPGWQRVAPLAHEPARIGVSATGGDGVAGTGNRARQAITVHRRAAGASYRRPGSPGDTVTVTVSY